MIHIDFEVPTDEGWLAWVRRARAARRECLQPGLENPASKINDRIYKEQRALLLNAFHKKCAYCESPIPANLRWGDIDHYRPKGRVTDQDGTPVFSKQKRHKGYYWLAYRWENLLPCCPACNRPGTGPDGLNSGKWDRFPTANKDRKSVV